MAIRIIKMPPPRITSSITLGKDDTQLFMQVEPKNIYVEQKNVDLIFTQPNGARVVLKDFFAEPESPKPSFVFGDIEVEGQELLNKLGEQDMPALGPVPPALLESHGYYEMNTSELMGGIDALGGLDLPWYKASVVNESLLRNPLEFGTNQLPLVPNTIPDIASYAFDLTEDAALDRTQGNVLLNVIKGDGEGTFRWLGTARDANFGSLERAADGSFRYILSNKLAAVQQLSVGDTLQESFSYTYTDSNGDTAKGILTITIHGSNDTPVAVADFGTVVEDGSALNAHLPAPLEVDQHDTHSYTPQSSTAGTYGSLTLAADGSYTYTLNNSLAAVQQLSVGDTLTETFTYTVQDNHGATSSNTLTITIKGSNDNPSVTAATGSITEDGPVLSATLPTPADVDQHDTLSYVAQSGTAGIYGSLTLAADGSYTYTLNNSLAAVQQLSVGDTLTETFTYTVQDDHGGTGTNTLTITIRGSNDNPTASAATGSITEDGPVLSAHLPAPADVDQHDTLSYVAQSSSTGTYGSLTLAADGSYSYTLNNSLAAVQELSVGDTLTETFTYTVQDDHGGTGTNTLTITIKGSNDNPTVAAATGNITEDGPVLSATLPAPADVDQHDTLSYVAQSSAAGTYGSLTLAADGSYTYTLNNSLAAVQELSVGDTLTETFTYTVQDDHGGTGTNTLTITIKGSNDNPTVAATTGTITEDGPILSATLPTPADVDQHDTLSYVAQSSSAGTYGSLTLAADGSYSYTLDNSLAAVQQLSVGDTLTETFTYTVQDDHGGTGTNTLTITIKGSNDNPTVAAATGTITEDGPILSANLPVPADVDQHDTLSYVAQSSSAGAYGSLTLAEDGSYSYSLNNALAAVQELSVGDTLTETFTYTVQDDHGGTGTNTLTITIKGSNDNPTVAAATGTITEDGPVLSATLPTPADVDQHDTLSYVAQSSTTGTYGSLVLAADGSYTYTLDNSLAAVQQLSVGDSLTETFTYTVQDDHGGTGSNTLTITIKGSNDNPTASAATGTITEDGPVLSASLPAPADVDQHDILSYAAQSSTAGTYGSLTLAEDGSYSYTLNNSLAAVQELSVGDTLTETFTYTVQDDHGGTGTNTLTITIKGSNDNPTVAAATGSITEDGPVLSATLPAPADVDQHDTLSYVAQSSAAGTYGSLTLAADGSYSYTLNNSLAAVQELSVGDTLTETFTYTVQDDHGGTGTNTLTITITGSNDNPTASAATGTITEDGPVLSAILPAPADVDQHDTLSYVAQSSSAGTYGSLTLAADGSYSYTLNNSLAAVQELSVGDTLTETFTYTVQDDHGGTGSNTLTITIKGSNDNPTASAATGSITEDGPVLSASLPTPADVDQHDTLSYVALSSSAGTYGSLTLAADGSYSYTLNNSLAAVQELSVGDTLTETFTYTVQDDHGGTGTNTLTITIKGSNDNPTVAAATGAITEDGPVLSAILPAPADVDQHDTLSYVAQSSSAGTYGSLTLAADGSYSYTLNNSLSAVQELSVGDTLTETFTYTVQDDHGGTGTNTLTITIKGSNDNPTVAAATGTITEDGPILSATLPTPADVDQHDTLSYVAQSSTAGTYGSLTLAADGSYSYTLNNSLSAVQELSVGDTLTETFTYTVQDDHGGTGSNTLTITIKGSNDNPTASAATGTITEDGPVLSAILPAPADVDQHDTLSYVAQSSSAGTYGSLTLAADGSYSYTLNNSLAAVQQLSVGDTLTETFTYTVQDDHGGTGSSTLTITIKGSNDNPTASAATGTITEDGPVLSASLPAPADVDQHDILSYAAQSNTAGTYGSLTLAADGSYTYTLNNSLSAVQQLSVGDTLTETFTYTVQDNHGGTGTSTLTITIKGSNDAPIGAASVGSITEDGPVLSATLSASADVDQHDTLTFAAQSTVNGTYGVFSLQTDGSYTYTLNNSLAAVQQLSVGDTLTETFTYTAEDNHGGTGTSTLTITIKGSNDNPTVAASTGTITEDGPVLSASLPTPADVDQHDTLSYAAQSSTAGTYGNLTLAADGSYTYTLNNSLTAVQQLSVGDTLTETFTYTVKDNHGGTGTNTLTITIKGSNDAPVGAASTGSINEDGPVLNATLSASADVDQHDILSFAAQSNVNGTYGVFTLQTDGSYTYTLNNSLASVQKLSVGDTLTETFNYTVQDNHGGTGTSTLTITINGSNDKPTVAAATGSITEDGPALSAVLPTPADVDQHDTLSYVAQSSTAGIYGSLTLGTNGSYTYTLNNSLPAVQKLSVGDSLSETFTYTVQDNHGGTGTNTLTITINGSNDKPTASAATGSISEDGPALSASLPAPADIDQHDIVSYVAQSSSAGLYGSLTLGTNGAYTYTLNNSLAAVQQLSVGDSLTETFVYTVQDNHGGTGTNTLTITINGSNDKPTVAAATGSITEDGPALSAILPTPADIDQHDTLSYVAQSSTAGTYGSLTLGTNGSYTYTLNNSLAAVQKLSVGDSLSETFTYTVQDNHGGTVSNTLTITINGSNDKPTVAATTGSISEDGPALSANLPTPADVDQHDTLSYVAQSSSAGLYGSLTLGTNGAYTYTLNNALAAVQQLSVGDSLTEIFTYTVQDNHGGTGTNTLTITINGSNDKPTVAAATGSITEDGPALSAILPTPADIDQHDTLSYVAQSSTAGTYGSLSLGTNGSYTYTLNNSLAAVQKLSVGDSLSETFTYTVQDNHGGTVSNTLTITINGSNDKPTVAAATGSINEDGSALSATLPTPADIDLHDTLSYVTQSNTAGLYGSLTLGSNGAYTYTLNNALAAVQQLSVGDSLTEIFTYTVQDNHGGTVSNTLTITINGSNDKPTVAAATGSISEDGPALSAVLPNPADVDQHDTLSYVAQGSTAGTYGSLTLAANGSYTYTLNNSLAAVQQLSVGDKLTESFTYTVQDNHGGTVNNTLTITINGTNDKPSIGSATGSLSEDTPQLSASLPALSTVVDVDAHDTHSYVPQTNTAGFYGTLTLAANGTYTYNLNTALNVVQSLNPGESLTEVFTYAVSDGKGGTGTNTLTLTITGTNDAPVVGPATASVTEDVTLTAGGALPTPTDVDTNSTVSFVPQTNTAGSYGTLTLLSTGSYTYTLNNSLGAVQGLGAGQKLNDVFTYTVKDNLGATSTNTLTVTVNGTNDLPTVGASTRTIAEDTAQVTGSYATPTDPDNTADGIVSDTLTFVSKVNAAGSYGTLTSGPAGAYTYILNNSLPAVQALSVGDTLTDVFSYTVGDGKGGTATNTLTITITGTNDKPTVGAASASVTEDTNLTASGTLPTPVDIDAHDTVSFVAQTNKAGSYGSLTLGTDGTYTYTLNNSLGAVQGLGVGQKLTDTFTYTVQDNQGGTGTNILTVTINGTNDTPSVGASVKSIAEDTATVSGTLATPTDPDNTADNIVSDTLTFSTKTNELGSYGKLTLAANGTYTYTLNNTLSAVQSLSVGDSLTDVFTYTVNDGKGGTATNTLTITITGTNDTPSVGAATDSVTEDTVLTASGTLPTPTDIDAHDTLSFTTKTNESGSYGKLTLAADGSYTYTLSNSLSAVQALGIGEKLTDTFTYTVNDDKGGTTTNTLTVTINGTNDNPTVAASTASVKEDSQLTASGTIPVPADVDSHDTVSIVPQTGTAGSYGTFTLGANGAYTYTLNNSLSAVQSLSVGDKLTDTFTYTVTDNHGATGTNTITVTINGTNDVPSVGATAASVTEDTATVATGSLATPQDIDIHDVLTFVAQTNQPGTYGTLQILANGTYTYTLNNSMGAVQGLAPGETLMDAFTYRVLDGHGGSASNTLTITINGTNDAPTVMAVSNAVTEDTTLTASGTVPFPLDPDNVADGKGTDIVTLVPQSGTQGLYGTLVLQSNGNYTYTLNNTLPAVQGLGMGESLSDVFTYSATDNLGTMGSNTITITINGTNDTPSVGPASNTVKEDTQTSVTSTLPTPTDPDNSLDGVISDTLTFIPKTAEPGRFGSLTLAANGTYTYTLNNSLAAVQGLGTGETLTETFQYTVQDEHGAISNNILTITVNGNNDAPTANFNFNYVNEDTKLNTSGQVSASDPDNTLDGVVSDTLTFTPIVSKLGSYGTLNLLSDGTYSYVLNNTLGAVQGLTTGQVLSDPFTFTVSDGKGGTSSNTVYIEIRGTNDAPTVTAASATVIEDTQLTASGKIAVSDLDNTADNIVSDTLHFSPLTNVQGTYGVLNLDANGNYTYTLNNSSKFIQALSDGQNLQEVFNYTVTDDHGGVSTSTFTVTIQGLSNDGGSGPPPPPPDMSVQEDLKLTDTSNLNTANNPNLVYTPQTSVQGTYGVFTLNANGTYSYTLNNSLAAVQGLGTGEALRDSFTYTVSDGTTTTQKTAIIEIAGNNDPITSSPRTASVKEDTQVVASGGLLPGVDPDNTADGIISDRLTAVAQTTVGTYGTLTVLVNGSYTYVLNTGLAAVQKLGVGESMTENFNFTLSDNAGSTSTNTLTVTINGTNDNPTVVTGYKSLTEGAQTSASGNLPAASDVDVNDVISYGTSNQTGAYGRLQIQSDGSYVYTLDSSLGNAKALGAGKSYTEVFSYSVSDGHGGSAGGNLLVIVNGRNDAPTVGNATAQVTEDSARIASGAIAPPVDPDTGDIPHFVAQNNTAGQYGTFFLSAAGAYSYTLNNDLAAVQALGVGETLTDTFTYTVTDDKGGTGTGQMTVTVKGSNDAPTVSAATTSVVEDSQSSASGTLPTPQDTDIHDVLSFTPKAVTGTYGTFTLQSDGSYTYALNSASAAVQSLGKDEKAIDTFTYTVTDGHGGSATNTLTVNITGTNDAPVSGVITTGTGLSEDGSENVLTGNLIVPADVDAHDTVTFVPSASMQGTYGTLTVQANGSYTYTMNNSLAAVQALSQGQTGVDSFIINAVDGQGGNTPTTLNIQIQGANDIPSVGATTGSIGENTATMSGTLTTPTDIDLQDVLQFTPQTAKAGSFGSLTLLADGSYTYTLNTALAAVEALNAGQSLTETFNYSMNDGHGGTASNTLTITINGANDAPIAAAATASIAEDALTKSGTLPTAVDVDSGDSAQALAQAATAGQYGSLHLNADGTYTYTLDNTNASVQSLGVGESLTDTFIYTVQDGHNATGSNTLTITINGTNDAPTVAASTGSIVEDSASLSGTLPAPQDVDVNDSPAFVAQAATAGQFGSLHLNTDGTYTYTLDNTHTSVQGLGTGESLTDSFTYTVSDGHGGTASNTLTITINGTNDAPTVAASTGSIAEDSASMSGTLSAPQDVDVTDSPAFVVQAATAGQYGSLHLNADGTYTYTLDNTHIDVQGLGTGESLTDSFTYTVDDGHGGTASNTLTITINGTNDAPTVAASTGSIVEDSASLSGTLPAPQDVDVNDSPAFVAQAATAGQFGSLHLNTDGTYTYTLDNSHTDVQGLGTGESLTDSFTYTVDDGHGGTASNTLTLTINGTNDAPTVAASAGSIAEDSVSLSGTLSTPHDVDVNDSPAFVAQSATAGQYGSLHLNADGTYTYTLDNTHIDVQGLGTGESLTDSFTYTVDDGHGGTASNTLTMTINGVNDAPTVAASTGSIDEGSANLTGTLPTAHDADVHDSPVFVTQAATTGQYGSLHVDADGSYTYTLDNANTSVQNLNTGESLTDNFSYTVDDGHGGTGSNTLTLTINGMDSLGTSLLNGSAQDNFNIGALSTLNMSGSEPSTSTPQSPVALDTVLSFDPNLTMDDLQTSVAPTSTTLDTTTSSSAPAPSPTITPVTEITSTTSDTSNLQDAIQQDIVKNANG